jgi:NAD(P)-dependent dehydrogenase (short-subunit alcohol dehydrogenase family)
MEQGARVMLADLNEASLASAIAGWDSARAAYEVVDVSNSAQVKRLFERTALHFGGVDVIFSNAGNMGVICPLAEFPEDEFDRVLAVHVKGAFLCCKHGIAAMRDGGSVIITSSIVGVRGDPGAYAYITAKHAQVGLMRSVAKEAAARNIRVNTIHPGPIANEFQRRVEANLSPVMQRDAGAFFDQIIPLQRHGRPEEVARSVLYLASEQSSFVTGSLLMVDGGMSA